MRASLIFCFLFSAGCGYAQYTSSAARFTVDQIRGCAPLTVNLTYLFPAACTPCLMDYLGNNPQPPPANLYTFIYTTPGVYKLTVVSQPGISDDITITVDANVPPPFDIFTCAGSKVSIDITDKTYDSYAIDFQNDGVVDKTIPSGLNQTASFSYGAPGSYNISVKGQRVNTANNCNPGVQSFAAVAALPVPTLNSLTAVDGSTLQLAYTPQVNIEYHSEIAYNNATNFQVYQTLYAVNSLTVPNLTVDTKFYCLRLASYDPCANVNTYSAPICSQDLSLAVASGTDNLAWQTASTGIANIQLIRTDPSGQTFVALPGTATSYNDNAIICKTNYCYQLVSNYASGATSTSLSKCGVSFLIDSPTPITNTSTVVSGDDSQVNLVWTQDPAFTATSYIIFRSSNASTYGVVGNATTTQYTDSYNGGSCYKINYTDACDNASADGAPACPILLTGSVDARNHTLLQWNDYQGWNLGVKDYVVEKYNSQGLLIQTVNVGLSTSYTDTVTDDANQILFFRVVADAKEAGVSTSISNKIRIVKGVNLWYPTAFNPESKSPYNRTFTVRGHFILNLQLEIFDRWGSLVFFSDKNEAWDGRREGSTMPDATYVWTAQGTDVSGGSFRKAGTVVLLRK